MPDIALSVTVSRDLLGLPDLELNDHVTSYVSRLLGSAVSWNRNQVSSPYVDGAVTVTRYKGIVNEPLELEVLGDSVAESHANAAAIVAAIQQDSYLLTVTLASGTVHIYQCEAADFQVSWDGPREMAHQLHLTLTIPRQPNPVAGGY